MCDPETPRKIAKMDEPGHEDMLGYLKPAIPKIALLDELVFTPGKAWDPKFTKPLTDHDKKVIELHEGLHRDYQRIMGPKASLSDQAADDAVLYQIKRGRMKTEKVSK
jgi:hypothetical protein